MKRFFSVLLVLILLAGVGVLLYPTVSDQINQYRNARLIDELDASADDEEAEAMRKAAVVYNRKLDGAGISDAFSDLHAAPSEEYMSLLNANGDGIMAVIEIPKIGVKLPIYHTVADSVLETGVGHVEGTSLPVGGNSTHCVLAGHRGLPSARLFTDIDSLELGDVFYITTLGQRLVYQVDQILVVEPDDTSEMRLFRGKDFVTMVTCTPYGINTQRLLVRGSRVRGGDAQTIIAETDGVRTLPQWQSVLILSAPVFLVGLIVLSIVRRIRRRR